MDFKSWAQNELRKIREQPRAPESDINPELAKTFPPERLEKIKKRELKAYAKAQDKKWNNFLKSVNK